MKYHTPKKPPDIILDRLRREYSFSREGLLLRNGAYASIHPNDRGYLCHSIRIRCGGRKVYILRVHHIIYFLVKGIWPPQELDHINRFPLDNRPCNLRLATRHEQACNRGNASVYGVCVQQRSGKFRAQVHYKGRTRQLGTFSDRSEAVARVKLARFLVEAEEVEGRAA
jgi:hypothetical protein